MTYAQEGHQNQKVWGKEEDLSRPQPRCDSRPQTIGCYSVNDAEYI
jgi:hypothetical protein